MQIFEANVGYKREFTLTSADGETFEEELTWGVDSEIGVKAGYVADASLVVDERKQVLRSHRTTATNNKLYCVLPKFH